MSDNYLMLNGQRIELTQEQIETLVGKKEKDPFERVEPGETYYAVGYAGNLFDFEENGDVTDNSLYETANYCTDKELLEQRALHETLNRLLWRYSMQNGGEKIKYGKNTPKYFILWRYNIENLRTEKCFSNCALGVVYFDTEDTAENAIEEIVKPFMEQHPEFRW